jgi:hypothetical protein
MAHVAGPERSKKPTRVWICEYPYRTMRPEGPSAECSDCPVWQSMQRARSKEDKEAVLDLELVSVQIH